MFEFVVWPTPERLLIYLYDNIVTGRSLKDVIVNLGKELDWLE